MGSRSVYLLGALFGVGALMLVLRYTKAGQVFAVDAVESVSVSAGNAVQVVTDFLATLGDWTRKIPAALRDVFARAAAAAGLPAGLLEAVAWRESRFKPEVINGSVRSSAGAVGIMQIIPKWHPELGESGALNPERAIPYAANYLSQLRGQFGTWELALAAYNWGPGNLKGHEYSRSTWPAETRAYVAEILTNSGQA